MFTVAGTNSPQFAFLLESSNFIIGKKRCQLLTLKWQTHAVRFPENVCQKPKSEWPYCVSLPRKIMLHKKRVTSSFSSSFKHLWKCIFPKTSNILYVAETLYVYIPFSHTLKDEGQPFMPANKHQVRMLTFHVRVPGSSPRWTPHAPPQGQQIRNDSGTWAPDAHIADLDCVPGSWLQPGLPLAVWGVNKGTGDLCLSLNLLPFQIQKF